MALAICAFAGGMTTLLGWFEHVPRLTDWLGSDIPMFANTALGAVLTAIALLVYAKKPQAVNLVRALGLTVALLGLATLFEHISGFNLAIDTLLINPTYGTRAVTGVGRMGPPASVGYIVLGSAIVALTGRIRRRLIPGLVLFVSSISMLSIVGYLFNADPLFASAKVTATALQTSIVLLTLALAVLFSVPDVEPLRTLCEKSAAGALMRRALPVAIVFPALLGWLFIEGRHWQFFDRGLGTAALALSLSFVFCALVAWCATDVRKYEHASNSNADQMKRAERQLKRLNKQLEAFLETAAVGLHRVAENGTILWANAAELELLGYTADEYIGHHIAEFHADGPVINDILKRLTCGQKLYGYEARLRCKDGSIKDVLIDSSVLWEDGKFMHTQCFTRDITDYKKAVDALRESDRRSRALLEAMPAAVYTTDAQGRITMYNQAAVEFSGRTPKIGTDEWCVTWKLYWPDGRRLPHDQCPMALALREGRPNRGYEAIAERPDGSRVHFMPFPTPLRNEQGELTGAINMLVDITERKRGEETAARLAAIVEGSNDAIISKDLNGIIHSWNKSAERLFGYTAEEVIGQPVTMLFAPGLEHEEPKILERIRSGLIVDHFETVRRRKDGSLFDVSLTISPMRDAHGHIIGASKILRDITERKRIELELQKAKEILEEKV